MEKKNCPVEDAKGLESPAWRGRKRGAGKTGEGKEEDEEQRNEKRGGGLKGKQKANWK